MMAEWNKAEKRFTRSIVPTTANDDDLHIVCCDVMQQTLPGRSAGLNMEQLHGVQTEK